MKTTVRVILSNQRVSRAPEDNHEITFAGIQKVEREVDSLPLLREDIFPRARRLLRSATVGAAKTILILHKE